MGNGKATHYGTCSVCFGQFKVEPKSGKMVDHGYKRPGHGEQVGQCPGVGFEPYEVSSKGTQAYLAVLQSRVVDEKKYLVKLQAGEVKTFYVYKGPVEVVKEGEPRYPLVLRQRIRDCEWSIKDLTNQVHLYSEKVSTWAPGSLVPVEQVESQVQAGKAAEKAAKLAEKAAKLAAKVASYQRRVDSAYSKKKAESLASIFESILCNFAGAAKVSKPEALALVARNHVWEELGLVVDGEPVEGWRSKIWTVKF